MGKCMKAWMSAAVACLVVGLAVFLATRRDAVNVAVSAAGTGPAGSGASKYGIFSEEELKEAEALSASAARGDGDLVARARVWAGTTVTRRIWVCDIVRNAKRVDALAILARDAFDACRGDGATYRRLFRTRR